MYQELLNFQFWGNTGKDCFFAFLVFFVSLIVLKVIQKYILNKLEKLSKKTKTDIDDIIIVIAKNVRPPVYLFVALYFGFKFLTLSALAGKIIDSLFIFIIVFEVVRAFQVFIDYSSKKIIKKMSGEDDDPSSEGAVNNISVIVKILIWIFAVLVIFSNWGINITSVVAGLGIGGIAIAFALQNILSDIFSSFSIFIDKPFKIGDFIIIGDDMGVVEKIGIKTTRITTLQGQELVVSNQELTTVRVHNYKKMQKRRVVFALGVCYDTKTEKMKKITVIIKDIINKIDLTEFNRAHFKDYGDFSLNFEVVYYIDSSDYNEYMDIQQSINFGIKEVFEKEGIEFAFPTQTVYVKKCCGS